MSDKQTVVPDPLAQGRKEAQELASPQEVDLVAVKLSDTGRVRPHNEDYVDFFVPPDPQQRARKGAIYLVADGMGGHQAGEVASRGAVELAIRGYYDDPSRDVGKSLVRAIQAANQQLHAQAQADQSKSGMGTTLVAAVVLGRKVYVANVGDSRAYLINNKNITQITEDHSWVEEQVRAGLLTHEQAKKHPQRNLVTRALGSKPAVDVDLFEGEISKGDTLLLCSDGLTGRVDDREVAAIVRQHPPHEATRILVDTANERGGNDNITVLIVSTEAAAVVAPAPAAPPGRRAGALPSWFIPALVGGVALVAVLLGTLWATGILFKAKPDATPSPPVAAATETGAVEAATEDASLSPVATEADMTPGTAGATSTLAATSEVQPTSTPTSSGLLPGQPSPTPTPTLPKPILTSPLPSVALQGVHRFEWTYSRTLGPNQAFQVLIWKEGETDRRGAADSQTNPWQEINLDAVPKLNSDGPGEYLWSVVVVDSKTDKPISPEATPRKFIYLGPTVQTTPTFTPSATLPPTKIPLPPTWTPTPSNTPTPSETPTPEPTDANTVEALDAPFLGS